MYALIIIAIITSADFDFDVDAVYVYIEIFSVNFLVLMNAESNNRAGTKYNWKREKKPNRTERMNIAQKNSNQSQFSNENVPCDCTFVSR